MTRVDIGQSHRRGELDLKGNRIKMNIGRRLNSFEPLIFLSEFFT